MSSPGDSEWHYLVGWCVVQQ